MEKGKVLRKRTADVLGLGIAMSSPQKKKSKNLAGVTGFRYRKPRREEAQVRREAEFPGGTGGH